MIRPGEQAELLGSVRLAPRAAREWLAGLRQQAVDEVIPSSPPAGAPGTFTIGVVNVGTGSAVLVRGTDFRLVYDAGSNDDAARGPNNRMVAYMKQPRRRWRPLT
jgi:hypothetical protein